MKTNLLIVLTVLLFVSGMQPASAQKITKADLLNTYSDDDSSKAMINLFYRKRSGAQLLGGLGIGLAGTTARVADNPGTALGGMLLFSPLYISGITTNLKYKHSTLMDLLERRRQGEAFPVKYSSKLKPFDFAETY